MDYKLLTQQLERIEEALRDVRSSTANIDVTLARQHTALADHIRRTELLENQMAPVATHVAVMGALGKIVLGSGGVAGLIALAYRLLRADG